MLIGTTDLIAELLGQNGQRPHEGAANTEDMNMHRRILSYQSPISEV